MNPPTTSSQALQNLQSFQGTEQSPDQILTSQEQSLGVPQAQQQVTGLRGAIQNTTNLLNQVAPAVYGRTQNSLVTDAQATRQIGNEQAPISATLNKENTDYGNQESDLQNLLSQSGTLAGLKAQGQSGQESLLQSIYQDLYGQEQDTTKNQLAQEQLDEQAREANLKSSSSDDGLGSALASILGGSTPASSASYGLKVANAPGSGYYFRDANGNPISALQYAQASGTDYNTLIKKMAASGDSGAQQYLKLGAPTSASGPYSSNTLALIKDFIG